MTKQPTASDLWRANELPSPWLAISSPPEPYEIAYLFCTDHWVRRGTWNGKMWWGYDERVRRSHELTPLAWRPCNQSVTLSFGRMRDGES